MAGKFEYQKKYDVNVCKQETSLCPKGKQVDSYRLAFHRKRSYFLWDLKIGILKYAFLRSIETIMSLGEIQFKEPKTPLEKRNKPIESKKKKRKKKKTSV